MPKIAINLLRVRQLWLVLALLWAGIVLFYSLQPSVELPGIFRLVKDLVLHFGAYSGVSFLLMGYSRSTAGPIKVSVLSFGYGLAVEILQPIVAEGRMFSWLDVLANSVGIGCGIVLALIIRRRIFNPKHKSV
ncbi:MAG: VanZ family protein [Bacteroidota bacterium]